MILNITAFKERPGIAVVLPTKFNFLSFFGFTLIQKVATYAPCTPTSVSGLVTTSVNVAATIFLTYFTFMSIIRWLFVII